MFDLLVLNVFTAFLCDCFSSCRRETLTKSIIWGEKRCCQAWQQRLTSLVYLQPNNWYWHLTEWTIMKTKSSVFSAVFTQSHLFSWFINLEDTRLLQRWSGHFFVRWTEVCGVLEWWTGMQCVQMCSLWCVKCGVGTIASPYVSV